MTSTSDGGGRLAPNGPMINGGLSLERLFEVAHATGDLVLTCRNLKSFPKHRCKYDLKDTVSVGKEMIRLLWRSAENLTQIRTWIRVDGNFVKQIFKGLGGNFEAFEVKYRRNWGWDIEEIYQSMLKIWHRSWNRILKMVIYVCKTNFKVFKALFQLLKQNIYELEARILIKI